MPSNEDRTVLPSGVFHLNGTLSDALATSRSRLEAVMQDMKNLALVDYQYVRPLMPGSSCETHILPRPQNGKI